MRLIVFGGKGGVGKSSISAATAVKLSKLTDKNILIISFDMAHNLCDLFATPVGNNLTQISTNLWAIEPDPDEYAEQMTSEFAERMRVLAKATPIVSKISTLEEFIDKTLTADSIPLSAKNSMFFQRLLDADEILEDVGEEVDLLSKMKFDYVIADFPPTGNMIALFDVPQNTIQVLLKYSLETMAQVREFVKGFKKVTKVFNPLSWGRPEDQKNHAVDVLKALKALEKRGERVTKLMKENGSLRLVSIAEKPSYEEAKRAHELSIKYISVDAIHVNRIIEKKYTAGCEMCNLQRKSQDKYIEAIKGTFNDMKVWLSHRLKNAPIGMDGLMDLADEIYGKDITLDEILYPKNT